MKAVISYHVNSQKKPNYFRTILTKKVLDEICKLTTGQNSYKVITNDEGYNHGRLLTVTYNETTTYVTLSETENNGRNSSLQSVPTAINIFYSDPSKKKRIAFYFLPTKEKLETNYHSFMYRLMRTANVDFLNCASWQPFESIHELIHFRTKNQKRNRSNNSSYILFSENNELHIYAKTYGANKYESTLLTIACASLFRGNIILYNVHEKELKVLPKSSLKTIKNNFQNVTIINSSRTLEKKKFAETESEEEPNLRSPHYVYHLLKKLGPQQCVCCKCPIPQIVQGAHIWPVAAIKREQSMNVDEKFDAATSGDNGLWLCENHHKLFDSNILQLDNKGIFSFSENLSDVEKKFAFDITKNYTLPPHILTNETIAFINKRNEMQNSSKQL